MTYKFTHVILLLWLQEAHRLVSEGQEELYNFDEEFIDLDQETLEAEATDFRVSYHNGIVELNTFLAEIVHY